MTPRRQTRSLGLLPVSTEDERRRRAWMYKCLVAISVAAAIMVLSVAIFRRPWIALPFAVVVQGGVMVLLYHTVKLSGTQWNARKRLRESGYKICPQCSYDLATLSDEGACPECGTRYDPAILRERWEAAYTRMLEKPGR